ncbi:sulfatase-like hydrolase/transferase [Novipirellula aureliae]|nr:sulfatase-like hydrolase/transferase [Novipirellula aureliae]
MTTAITNGSLRGSLRKAWGYGLEDFLKRLVQLVEGTDEVVHRHRTKRTATISVDDILVATAKQYNVTVESYSGFHCRVGGRDDAAYRCRRYTSVTLAELSKRFGLGHPDRSSDLIKRGKKQYDGSRQVLANLFFHSSFYQFPHKELSLKTPTNRNAMKNITLFIACVGLAAASVASAADRPNVIVVMTDDQGYGDMSCHGNPILETPNIDQLYRDSVRMTDFHVSPFCTPTRAALMTGRYPARTGAYRTSSGRTLMHTDERTIANVFADAGYVTGMVGKWHLGDNAPHRPQDRGFQDVLWHRCGGVGQASDFWGNDYFDDTYERNGKFEKFEGYCTDVWFRESIRFIEENKAKPFFLYLATNAPHGPYRVDPKWAAPYQDKAKWGNGANFYGMIANFDHNLGELRRKLDELALSDNTILIYMTDNGTAGGGKFNGLDSEAVVGFNAGMRGKKSSVYEGGHRVPFFIHWPAAKINGGRDVDSLAAHIDVLPTLAELCGVSVADSHRPDGISFAKLLTSSDPSPHRDHLVVQFQGGASFKTTPKPWLTSCVLQDRWRLLNGKELYEMDADPAQRKDVAAEHPEVVATLREFYMPFWKSVSPRMTPVSIDLGNATDNPTELCSQDWYMPRGNPPWNFGTINRLPRVTGPWHVDVKQAGNYRITLRQFPRQADEVVKAVRGRVEIAGQAKEVVVMPGTKGVVIEMMLPAGKTQLVTYLYDEKGDSGGAYFTEVEWLPN